MGRGARGFTMIEILVVVTIVSVLMGLLVIIIPLAFGQRDETITVTRLQGVASAIEKLRSPQLLGQYPRAATEMLKGPKGEPIGKDIGAGNELNRGIETVYIAMNLRMARVRIDLPEDSLRNTDGDQMGSTTAIAGDSRELYEIVDAWFQPMAYFCAADYKNPAAVSKYVVIDEAGNSTVQDVTPWKSPKTGQYLNRDSFQLFSAGPDGIFNTPDDIGNFQTPQPEDK
jgi:prepilin-type N-terminal cleavage/methylation domain-containing protein